MRHRFRKNDFLSREARRRGISVRELVQRILIREDMYDGAAVRRNNFAKSLLKKKQEGGPVVDPMGQWTNPYKEVIVPTPSGQITMQGVPYPVLGQDETGMQQLMMPGGEYRFNGQYVHEIPFMQKGGTKPIIFVPNKNDSRIKAYQDSLSAYNITQNKLRQALTQQKINDGKGKDIPIYPIANRQYLTRQQAINQDFEKYKEMGLNITRKDIEDEYKNIDYLRGHVKDDAIGYYRFKHKNDEGTYTLADYKKPVQPYSYYTPELRKASEDFNNGVDIIKAMSIFDKYKVPKTGKLKDGNLRYYLNINDTRKLEAPPYKKSLTPTLREVSVKNPIPKILIPNLNPSQMSIPKMNPIGTWNAIWDDNGQQKQQAFDNETDYLNFLNTQKNYDIQRQSEYGVPGKEGYRKEVLLRRTPTMQSGGRIVPSPNQRAVSDNTIAMPIRTYHKPAPIYNHYATQIGPAKSKTAAQQLWDKNKKIQMARKAVDGRIDASVDEEGNISINPNLTRLSDGLQNMGDRMMEADMATGVGALGYGVLRKSFNRFSPLLKNTTSEFPKQTIAKGRTIQTMRGHIDWGDAVNRRLNPDFDPRAYENYIKSPYVEPDMRGIELKQKGGTIAKKPTVNNPYINYEKVFNLVLKELYPKTPTGNNRMMVTENTAPSVGERGQIFQSKQSGGEILELFDKWDEEDKGLIAEVIENQPEQEAVQIDDNQSDIRERKRALINSIIFEEPSYLQEEDKEVVNQPSIQKISSNQPSKNVNTSSSFSGSSTLSGNSIAARHNNPGNLKFADWMRQYGAVPGDAGTDGGRFAKFPSVEAAMQARRFLLKNRPMYANKTVDQAMRLYSNSGYDGSIYSEIRSKKMSELSDSEFEELTKRQIIREDINVAKQLGLL